MAAAATASQAARSVSSSLPDLQTGGSICAVNRYIINFKYLITIIILKTLKEELQADHQDQLCKLLRRPQGKRWEGEARTEQR